MRARTRVVAMTCVAAYIALVAGPAHAATLIGDGGNDFIFGSGQADRLRGLAGNDFIFGKSNPLGTAADQIDKLSGGDGLDALAGGRRSDLLKGGDDNDLHLDDDPSFDTHRSGAGNDNIVAADGGRDAVDCGPGQDAALVDRIDTVTNCEVVVTGSVDNFVTPSDPAVQKVTYGSSQGTAITTGSEGDIVFGRGGADVISLGDSAPGTNDFATGGAGADTLNGEAGPDDLVDDDGTPGDTLNGGGGADDIIAADGATTTIDCGANDSATDDVLADPQDTLINCEQDGVLQGHNQVL